MTKNTSEKIMTAERLLKIHSDLKSIGVDIILDGGWGVDALLEEQTRLHKDIDFFINKSDVGKVKKYFTDLGFVPSTEMPATEQHFILESEDAIADIHVIDIDDTGKGIYGPPENGAFFPAESLTGIGKINGVEVRCLTPEYRVECLTWDFGVTKKTGYKLKDTDYIDIAALCKKFNIEIPEEYLVFWGGRNPNA